MAKKEETTAPAVIEQSTEVEINGKVLNVEETLQALEGMKEGELIVSDYWTLEPGEEARVVFAGMTKMNKMNGEAGEMIDAVKLVVNDEDGKFNKINADKVIVSTCRNLTAPTALKITCIGKIKSSKGHYKDYEIRKLQ